MTLDEIERAIAAELRLIAEAEGRIAAYESLKALHPERDRTNTVRNMQPNESVRLRRSRRGRPPRSAHPFTLALDARGSSLAEWARKHRVEQETVRSWVRTVDGRRIPREMAEKIEAEFLDKETKVSAVPATLATWTNGIR